MKVVAPGDQRARLPGVYYTIFNSKLGRYVVIAWPKKRPNPSPVTQAQNDLLAQIMKLVRFAAGADRAAAGELVKGKGFIPQDALVSAAQGLLYSQFKGPNINLMSARMAQTDIELLLDSISSQPGSILVRTATEWMALLPGAANQVLTIDPVTLEPDWLDSGGGGGGGGEVYDIPSIAGSNYTSGAYATRGHLIIPTIDMSLKGMWANVRAGAGWTYEFNICAISEDGAHTVASVLGTSDTMTATGVPGEVISAEFSTPVSLPKDHPYCLALTRTDATGATTANVGTDSGGNSGYQSFPSTGGYPITGQVDYHQFLYWASKSPAPGDATIVQLGQKLAIGIHWARPAV